MENKLPGIAKSLLAQQEGTKKAETKDTVAVTSVLLDRKKKNKKMVKTNGNTGLLKNPRQMNINPSAPAVVQANRRKLILRQRGVQFTNTGSAARKNPYVKRRQQQQQRTQKSTSAGAQGSSALPLQKGASVSGGASSAAGVRTKKNGGAAVRQNRSAAAGGTGQKAGAGQQPGKKQKQGTKQNSGSKKTAAKTKQSRAATSAKAVTGKGKGKLVKTGNQSVRKMLIKGGAEKLLSGGGKNDDLGTRSISSAQKAYYKVKRGKEMVRRAYKGAKYTVKAASFVTKAFIKLISMIISALTSLTLPLLALILVVVVTVGAVLSFFGATSATETDTDLSDAYLYVTQLDAGITYNIRTENFGADQYQFYMNGNRVEGAAVQVRSDVEAMLALMESKYQSSALYTEIEGTLGGRTISEELSILHDYLYQYTTTVNTITVEETEVKTKFISVKTQLLESWVERNTWYLSKSDYDVLRVMSENGYFLLNKEIAPLFGEETARIYQDYGYYVNPAPEIVKDTGILLSVKKGIPIYAGFSGIAAEVGEDYVKVRTGVKEIQYYNMVPAVENGQEIKKGAKIGITGTNVVRVVYYKDDIEVCPTIYMEGLDKSTAGGGVGNSDIVAVALSQVGQVGGQPYWSWYGFGGRVEWCACFVSWCANQCGYLDSGVIFRHSGCTTGVAEWRRRGLFQEAGSGYVPKAGDIIYFDYDDPLYGKSYEDSDHVGIVQSSDGVYVYTIEGNSNDSVRQNTYSLGYADIKGYATPLY